MSSATPDSYKITVRVGKVITQPTSGKEVKCVKESCPDAVRDQIFKHLPKAAQKLKAQCKQMDNSYYYPRETW
jgi:hypothetical protein